MPVVLLDHMAPKASLAHYRKKIADNLMGTILFQYGPVEHLNCC